MNANRIAKSQRYFDSYAEFAERVVSNANVAHATLRAQLIRALSDVPRAEFIDPALQARALEDISLPIGFSQTISRPSTLVSILENLQLKPGEKVLEVGAGCGYFSALLSTFGTNVFGIEYVGPLAQSTRRRLNHLGYANVIVRAGDGMRGWLELAPFDAIVISAAVPIVPAALEEQLAPGHGRIVAPLEIAGTDQQELVSGRKDADGNMRYVTLQGCAFVTAQ